MNIILKLCFLQICHGIAWAESMALHDIVDLNDPYFLFPGDQSLIDFGFSLSLFVNASHRSLLVGAPSANTTQIGVNSPGALYSCDLSNLKRSTTCYQLEVDTRNEEQKYSPYIDSDLKSFQRLGASLSSQGDNVLVCAPNWHYYVKRITSTADTPVGTCFSTSASLEDFKQFSVPYDLYGDTAYDYLKTGSCQSGFSAVLTKNNDAIIGSPGCYNWQGDVFAKHEDSPWTDFGKSFTEKDIGSTNQEKPVWLSNMYMGYSIAEGYFDKQSGIVAGMPRSTHAIGDNNQNYPSGVPVINPRVNIFLQDKNKLALWTTLEPPKNEHAYMDSVWLFSYFGYAVAVADVDGNGLDDVIVGAPFYHNETNYDQGVILVYLQQTKSTVRVDGPKTHFHIEEEKNLRFGVSNYGRFGSCVSSVGDINADGIEDIAVGAPYAEGGKVFIYLGSREGLSENPSQIITASTSSLIHRQLDGFGASIAPYFMIEDGYQSDLAIGASSADMVVIFKSKVMINVEWTVKFPQKMDLSSNCNSKEAGNPCAEMFTCLSYSFLENGKVGDMRAKEFSLSYELDINSLPGRLFFDDQRSTRTTKIFIEFDKSSCYVQKVYTNRQINNLDAFEIRATISHIPRKTSDESTLKVNQITSLTQILEIQIECKSVDVSECISDLSLDARVEPSFVNIEIVQFDIYYRIENSGESSYSNKLVIASNNLLEISGKPQVLNTSTISPIIDCKKLEPGKSECSLGTFINKNDKLNFVLSFTTTESFLDISSIRNHPNKFEIKSSLTTLSAIKDASAVEAVSYVDIKIDPQIYLSKNGSSTNLISCDSKQQYVYPEEAKTDDQIGPEISHIYEIYNKMNYPVENNNITLYWPSKIYGRPLLHQVIPTRQFCTSIEKLGIAFQEMKGIPLVNDITWLITTCHVKSLPAHESVTIQVKSRLVVKTITDVIKSPRLEIIKSFLKLQSTPVLFGDKRLLIISNTIITEIDYSGITFLLIPIWAAVLIGVIIAVIILVFIGLCLRRNKFFMRKTTSANLPEDDVADEVDEEAGEEDEGVSMNEEVEHYDNLK